MRAMFLELFKLIRMHSVSSDISRYTWPVWPRHILPDAAGHQLPVSVFALAMSAMFLELFKHSECMGLVS